MLGPAGDLGSVKALLNTAGKLAGPAYGHVGRAAEEVNPPKPIFLLFFLSVSPTHPQP